MGLAHSALQELSPALRVELLRLLRKNIVKTTSLFRAIPTDARELLFPSLLEILTPSQHGPGDPIFHQVQYSLRGCGGAGKGCGFEAWVEC